MTQINDRLDRLVLEARRSAEKREQGYRAQALKLFPWVCGRCARTFDRANLQLLEVHHKNSNHNDNPPDGSNWELRKPIMMNRVVIFDSHEAAKNCWEDVIKAMLIRCHQP